MATISSLRKALDTASSSFRTISDLMWDGSPIVRSKYFAESRVMIAECPALVSIPLTTMALSCVEKIIPHKLHLCSDIIPHITLLRDEMYYMDAMGKLHTSDVLVEPLYDGMSLEMTLLEAKSDTALAKVLSYAIDKMEHELIRADISHNNLKESNIILDTNNTLRPIRWYYTTKGAGADHAAIESLREKIAAIQCDALLCMQDNAPYEVALCNHSHYLNKLEFSEGLLAIETEQGWGYIDCDCQIVIEPQFHWVSNFCEARAEVECDNGMGLIDKSGRYIIPPRYSIVDYDPVSGNSAVYDGSSWAEFDYMGNVISPFLNTEQE